MSKTATDAMRPDAKLDPVFARALREALFWLLMALALVMLIALASFDASDRSYSYTGEPGQVSNLIGPLGAWLASAFFLLFGWPAFLFPIATAFTAWSGFKRQPGEPGQGRSTIALYSRSQLGKSDLGVNRARIERWLEQLGAYAPVAE